METPAPHEREHALHSPHSPQPPAMGSAASPIGTQDWFTHHCKSKDHTIVVGNKENIQTSTVGRVQKGPTDPNLVIQKNLK